MNIQDAMSLLQDNGYIVVKQNDRMKEDCDKCTAMSQLGKDMECFTCSNNICLSEYRNRHY